MIEHLTIIKHGKRIFDLAYDGDTGKVISYRYDSTVRFKVRFAGLRDAPTEITRKAINRRMPTGTRTVNVAAADAPILDVRYPQQQGFTFGYSYPG